MVWDLGFSDLGFRPQLSTLELKDRSSSQEPDSYAAFLMYSS